MKIAISTASFFGTALVNLLISSGYTANGSATGNEAFLLVNTDKRTFKGAAEAGDRPSYNPASQWAAITSAIGAVAAATTRAATPAAANRSLVSAPTVSANTPVATAVDSRGTQLHVGDTVTMSNSRKTKDKFRLGAGRYVINLITASGKIGFAGMPNDQYLPKRATRVATVTAIGSVPTTPQPVRPAPAPARKPAVDAAGNTLAVGDTVLVVAHRSTKGAAFQLRENGVATITRITPNGAVGFAFDRGNEFLAKRFQKVTKEAVSVVVTPGRYGRPASVSTNLLSGDKVTAAPRSDRRFALAADTAYTFRGLTVDGGSLILDGQTSDQYAPSRFTRLVRVGTARTR